MNKAAELLTDKVFFLATDDAGQPRVRPFGAVASIEDGFYICTSGNKPVFPQMEANPKIEISGMLDEENYFRIEGVAVRDERLSSRQEFLRQNPMLDSMYKADDGVFEVLKVTGKLKVFAMGNDSPKEYELT